MADISVLPNDRSYGGKPFHDRLLSYYLIILE